MTHKFAFIENVSLSLDSDLEKINNTDIRSRFNDCVTFYDFDGTKDLFTKIHSLMGNYMLEIVNGTYNENTLTQVIYVENDNTVHDKMIVIKRKIRQDDSYTFLEFTENGTDIFEYDDVNYDELVNMIHQKYVHSGIIVNADNSIDQIEYVYIEDKNDQNMGTISYKIQNKNEIHNTKYLHLINIMQGLKDSSKKEDDDINMTEYNKIIDEKMNAFQCTHLYNQKDFKLGIFNFYSPVFGTDKNEIASNLLEDNIYGNVIITLETKLNNDERLLNLNDDLFQSILKTIKNSDFLPKNKHYFNIYNELH